LMKDDSSMSSEMAERTVRATQAADSKMIGGLTAHGPLGFGQMAAMNSDVTLTKPAAGQTQVIAIAPGMTYSIDFPADAANLSLKNGDLVFSFKDGSQLVLDNFQVASPMPQLMLQDGTILAGNVIVAQLNGDESAFNLETAAGPGGAGNNGHIYSDDLGQVISMLNPLNPIPFSDFAALATPIQFLQDDIAAIDLVPTAVLDNSALNNGATSVVGNALTNDAAGDGASTVTAVQFGGTVIPVPLTGTVTIQGLYGTLTIGSNGVYTYTLTSPQPANATTDVFNYQIADQDGDLSAAPIIIAIDGIPVINLASLCKAV
jgi:hypothetical protein